MIFIFLYILKNKFHFMDLKILSGQTINSEAELKYILNFLDSQGFGYFSSWEHHQRKIEDIISNANTLNINYDDKLKSDLIKNTNYIEAKKQADIYFSKFKPDDKIYELLNTFSIISDDSSKPPSYNYCDNNDIIKWVNFRLKCNVKDEFNPDRRVEYYNLDKNYLKINYSDNYEFKKLYALIYSEEIKDVSLNKIGEWIDIGKIEIKFFANGNANIKGDIQKFKEYYYNYIKKQKYSHLVIDYNKKREIYKSK
jgi:hypothetical protein